MVKEFKETVEIDVPVELVYSYFEKKFRKVKEEKSRYSSLSRHRFKKISSKKNEKIIFQEKYFFSRGTTELYFEKKGKEKTGVIIVVALTWSPLRKKMGESSLLGMTTNLRSLEFMYETIQSSSITSN